MKRVAVVRKQGGRGNASNAHKGVSPAGEFASPFAHSWWSRKFSRLRRRTDRVPRLPDHCCSLCFTTNHRAVNCCARLYHSNSTANTAGHGAPPDMPVHNCKHVAYTLYDDGGGFRFSTKKKRGKTVSSRSSV